MVELPKIIKDQFTALPLTRQQRYQARQRAKGRCPNCGRKSVKGKAYCKFHRAMRAYRWKELER